MTINTNFVGEFVGKGLKMGIRIPLTSDLNLNLEFTHNSALKMAKKEIYYSVYLKGGIV
jgi:hypothetical protein